LQELNSLLPFGNITEPTSVFDQSTDVNMFYTQPKWLNGIKENLKTKIN
jgi:hypothetical protein